MSDDLGFNHQGRFRFPALIEIISTSEDWESNARVGAAWMVENLQAHELLIVHLDIMEYFNESRTSGLMFYGMLTSFYKVETGGRAIETVTSVGQIMRAEQRLKDICDRGLKRMSKSDWEAVFQFDEDAATKLLNQIRENEDSELLTRMVNELQVLHGMVYRNEKEG